MAHSGCPHLCPPARPLPAARCWQRSWLCFRRAARPTGPHMQPWRPACSSSSRMHDACPTPARTAATAAPCAAPWRQAAAWAAAQPRHAAPQAAGAAAGAAAAGGAAGAAAAGEAPMAAASPCLHSALRHSDLLPSVALEPCILLLGGGDALRSAARFSRPASLLPQPLQPNCLFSPGSTPIVVNLLVPATGHPVCTYAYGWTASLSFCLAPILPIGFHRFTSHCSLLSPPLSILMVSLLAHQELALGIGLATAHGTHQNDGRGRGRSDLGKTEVNERLRQYASASTQLPVRSQFTTAASLLYNGQPAALAGLRPQAHLRSLPAPLAALLVTPSSSMRRGAAAAGFSRRLGGSTVACRPWSSL